MTTTDLIDRLAVHKTIGCAPREELAWLVAHGSLRQLKEGEIVSSKGVPVEGLFIGADGHVPGCVAAWRFLDRYIPGFSVRR